MDTGTLRRPGRPTPLEAGAISRAIEEAVLIEAASGCMGEISIERIAARAGVTRTAIYRRFKSKQALLRAAVAARVSHIKDRIEVHCAEMITPLDQLRSTFYLLMGEANSPAGLDLRRLLIATGPHDGLIRADLLAAQAEFEAICDDHIAAALRGARPNGLSVADIRELLLDALVTSKIVAALTLDVTTPPDAELERVFELRWQTLKYLFEKVKYRNIEGMS